jgi:hypothetical protein
MQRRKETKTRTELGNWRLRRDNDSTPAALTRLLIAVDELRARLNPNDYPNLEISDEGHLWFNVPASIGNLEVFAFPLGFQDLPKPALALSLPHRPNAIGPQFLEILDAVTRGAQPLEGAVLFAGFADKKESLQAYERGEQPPLQVLWGKNEILAQYDEVTFFNYFGLLFCVQDLDVSAVNALLGRIATCLDTDALR